MQKFYYDEGSTYIILVVHPSTVPTGGAYLDCIENLQVDHKVSANHILCKRISIKGHKPNKNVAAMARVYGLPEGYQEVHSNNIEYHG